MADEIEIEVGRTTRLVFDYATWTVKKSFWFLAYGIAAVTGLAVLFVPILLGLATVPAEAPPLQQVSQLAVYGLIWYYTARPIGMRLLDTISD